MEVETTIKALGELVPASGIRQAVERQKLTEREMESFHHKVGSRLKHARFHNYVAATAKQHAVVEAVKEWAKTFADRLRNGDSLVLFGPVGTGKDHLGVSAARQIMIEHAVRVRFINGRDFAGDCRDAMDQRISEKQLLYPYVYSDVLYLADPIPVRGDVTPYQADILYRIVEGRYSRCKPTICTLNVADDAEADSRLGVATWDRLCHGAWKLHCNWDTARKPARVV